MTLKETIESINNAFYRLESFMSGKLTDYNTFDFNKAFTSLFSETKKHEHYTYENCKLISNYWRLTERIRYAYDQADYDNQNARENEMFCNDCEDITYLNWDRIEEFCEFTTPDEQAEFEHKFSITDILEISKSNIENNINLVQSNIKLKHKQIALIHAYNDNPITSSNQDLIAKKYGYYAKNSGHKIKQLYNAYRRPVDRRGDTGSYKKNQNKIDDIKSIYSHLSGESLKVSKLEVSKLETIQTKLDQ